MNVIKDEPTTDPTPVHGLHSFDDMFAFTSENGGLHQLKHISQGLSGVDVSPVNLNDYSYHTLVERFENREPKFWNNLNDANKEVLHTVEEWIKEESIDMSILSANDIHQTLVVLRFLRANNFSRSKTKAHIVSCIAWRKEMDATFIAQQLPEVILGCSVEKLTGIFPHWHSGYDKTGRPVLYKQYGKFEATHIKHLCGGDFDRIVRYRVWEQEACARLCLAQTKKLKVIVETVTTVIDIEHMKLKQVNSDFIRLVSLLADVDGKQYPETVGRIFVINATPSFSVAWQLIKGWVVAATASKMKVLGGPKEFIPVLHDFIGEENLPSNYGGKLPALSPQVHPYAETMAVDFTQASGSTGSRSGMVSSAEVLK